MLRGLSKFGVFKRGFFVVTLTYTKSLEEINKHVEDHRNFLEECYKNKIFIASGPQVPRTGGIILASTKDKETLEKVLEKDPFKQHDLAEYDIKEFMATKHSEEFAPIAENDRSLYPR